MAKKQARMIAKQESKLAGQIARRDFAAVDLNKAQKQTLKNLVHAKFAQIQQLDQQVAASVPADKTKALNRAYRIATKNGQSKSEAMASSMMKAGFDKSLQEKILGFNQTKANLLQGIRDELTLTLDDKQKELLAKAAKAKMEMDASKEEKKSMKTTDNAITKVSVTIDLPGMTWASCQRSVERSLTAQSEFKNLNVDLASQTASFDVKSDFDFKAILNEIAKESSHVAGWKMN